MQTSPSRILNNGDKYSFHTYYYRGNVSKITMHGMKRKPSFYIWHAYYIITLTAVILHKMRSHELMRRGRVMINICMYLWKAAWRDGCATAAAFIIQVMK